MDVESAKATIRKLLNLANDEGAVAGEIQNAMRFAARLMEQHQLSDDDISEVDDVLLDLERAELVRQWQTVGGSKISTWEVMAAHFVCTLIGGVNFHVDRPTIVRNASGNRYSSLQLALRTNAEQPNQVSGLSTKSDAHPAVDNSSMELDIVFANFDVE